jgi:hypothetical protein
MSKSQIFSLLDVAALLAFIVLQVLLYVHAGHVQDIVSEQDKAQWLARRNTYNYISAVAFIASVGFFIAARVYRRRELNYVKG